MLKGIKKESDVIFSTDLFNEIITKVKEKLYCCGCYQTLPKLSRTLMYWTISTESWTY